MPIAPTKWEFLDKKSFKLPDDIENLFKQFDRLSKNLNQLLKNVKSVLTFVDTILIDGLNPLLLLFQFILEEILDFIDTLREAGIYHIAMMPDESTNSRRILYKDVFPGTTDSTTAGFYILTRDDLFQKYVASFDDEGDPKKPPTEDDAIAGGFVLFFGVGSDDVKLFVSGLTKMFELVQIVADLFQQLFGSDAWMKLLRETNSLLKIVAEITSIEYTALTNQSIGASTLSIQESIKAATPGKTSGGTIVLKNSSDNPQINYSLRYDSWTNTKTSHVFNLAFLAIKAETKTDSRTILSNVNIKNVKVGDLVLNVTRSNAVSYVLGITNDNRFVISPSIPGQTIGDIIKINAVPISFNPGQQVFVDDPKGPTLRTLSPTPNPTSPNWETSRIARDMIPSLGDLLDDIFGVVEGFKDQATGASQAMKNLIAFIESKISVIESVQAKITSTREYFQKIRDTFAALEAVKLANISILKVGVQKGGINILKQAILDETLENRPENFQYCMLFSVLGSGPGLGLIEFILGLRPTFDITEPSPLTIPFDEDAVKKEYGLT